MIQKVKGKYWIIQGTTVKLQIKTDKEQYMLEEALPGWHCVSYGYVPKTKEDIYIFERTFKSELDWTSFLKNDKVNSLIEIKEVSND